MRLPLCSVERSLRTNPRLEKLQNELQSARDRLSGAIRKAEQMEGELNHARDRQKKRESEARQEVEDYKEKIKNLKAQVCQFIRIAKRIAFVYTSDAA